VDDGIARVGRVHRRRSPGLRRIYRAMARTSAPDTRRLSPEEGSQREGRVIGWCSWSRSGIVLAVPTGAPRRQHHTSATLTAFRRFAFPPVGHLPVDPAFYSCDSFGPQG
jgi:hypothetical protein